MLWCQYNWLVHEDNSSFDFSFLVRLLYVDQVLDSQDQDPVKNMYEKPFTFGVYKYFTTALASIYCTLSLMAPISHWRCSRKRKNSWSHQWVKCWNSPTADCEVRAQLLCMEGRPALGNLHNNNNIFRFWAQIFKLFRSPRIGSKASIPPAYVAWVGIF